MPHSLMPCFAAIAVQSSLLAELTRFDETPLPVTHTQLHPQVIAQGPLA